MEWAYGGTHLGSASLHLYVLAASYKFALLGNSSFRIQAGSISWGNFEDEPHFLLLHLFSRPQVILIVSLFYDSS